MKKIGNKILFLTIASIMLFGMSISIMADGGLYATATKNFISVKTQPAAVSVDGALLLKNENSTEWSKSLNEAIDLSNLLVGEYTTSDSVIYVKNESDEGIVLLAGISLENADMHDDFDIEIYVGTETTGWRGQTPVYSGNIGGLQNLLISGMLPGEIVDIHFVAKANDVNYDDVRETLFNFSLYGEAPVSE